MQQKKFFIFILALTAASASHPMGYWNFPTAACAKLYATATQKTKQTLVTLHRISFRDQEIIPPLLPLEVKRVYFQDIHMKSDIGFRKIMHHGFLATTLLSSVVGALSVWNGDYFSVGLSFACNVLGALGSASITPAYNYSQLFEYLKNKHVSDVHAPIFKKWIMQQDPSIVPPEKLMALAKIILENKHLELYDLTIFKHLISPCPKALIAAHKNDLLIECCFSQHNIPAIYTLAKYFLTKNSNPHARETLTSSNACELLLKRQHDDCAKVLAMLLEYKPTNQKNMNTYLRKAIERDKISAVMVLLHHGAQINTASDGQGLMPFFPLRGAILRENANMVRYLLYLGADKFLLGGRHSLNVLIDGVVNEEIIDLLESEQRPSLTHDLRNLEWKLLTNPNMTNGARNTSQLMGLR